MENLYNIVVNICAIVGAGVIVFQVAGVIDAAVTDWLDRRRGR
jgi:hypothetical protein